MTIWEFLDKNMAMVVVVVALLIFGVKSLIQVFARIGGKGRCIARMKLGPSGVEVESSDKYSIEGLMLENQVLRQITRQIADLESRVLLQKQMNLVDEYMDTLVGNVNDHFRKYLSCLGTKAGEFYNDAIHDNDRVMKETRKSLVNRLRVAMRQNGFAHKSPAELREYVRQKFEALHTYANEIRVDVAYDEPVVADGFIEWNKSSADTYLQMTLELFQRCSEITIDYEEKISCLQVEYKLVEKTFLETGKIPAIVGICPEV